MLKKILFAIASILVGLVVISSSSGTGFYNEVIKQCANAVKDKNYIHAEKFVSYALDDKNMFFNDDLEDGLHVEIYSSLIISDASTYNDKGEVVKTVSVLEECIQISMFHLPETFALADKTVAEGETPIKGGVTLVLSNNSEVFFPFNDGTINLYDYLNYYSFLPMFISYEDYQEKVGTNTVSSLKVTDGNGEEKYNITLTKALSFDNEFHNEYHTPITNYKNLYLAYDENADDAKEQVEAINAAKLAIDAVSEGGKYAKQHNTDIIYKSSGYIWSLVLTVVIFLVIDGLLGFLLFRRRKTSHYVPRKPLSYHNTNNQPVARAPEQFSRKDVFDAEEGTFVIEDNKTEESEKTE